MKFADQLRDQRKRLAITQAGAHGGKRAGAGRKPGKKSVSRSVTMPVETWARVDAARGGLRVGEFLASLLPPHLH